uniref:MobH family relaxase n=1 Tax=Burkholderia arboris TaxID=488730 RepID=UPI003BEEFE7B
MTSTTLALMTGAVTVGAAALGVMLWQQTRAARPRRSATAVATIAPQPKLRQGQIAVQSGEALLRDAGLTGTLTRIRTSSGLAATNFDADLWPVIVRVAAFVQRLPASESHHHAHPGGLLTHVLEVTDAALRIRAGRILPRGAPIETAERLAHRWTYAVCLGALLHDIGRPVADLRIAYFKSPDGAPVPWIPAAGSLEAHGAIAYTVEFPPPAERNYQVHQRLPLILMQQLVPQRAMLWLGEDPALMRELSAFLSGQADSKDAIAEIVIAADRESVAANLLTGPRTRFKSARAVPLIERLMEALRRLIVEGTLPINQAGFAAGWSDSEFMWMVPKTVADAVRNYLEQQEVGETSGAGIPTDNNRIFDTWQEYGAVVANESGTALWHIEVELAGNVKTLNAVKFPLDRLYADPAHYPKPFVGTIRARSAAPGPVDASQEFEGESGTETARSGGEGGSPGAASDAHVDEGEKLGPVESTAIGAAPAEAEHAAEAPTIATTDTVIAREAPSLPAGEAAPAQTAAPMMKQRSSSKKLLDDAAASTTGQSGEAAADDRPAAEVAREGAAIAAVDPYAGHREPLSAEAHPTAAHFIRWLQEGIVSRAIPHNSSGAFVHFVPEGMLLVSPVAFKVFCTERGIDGEGTSRDDPSGYMAVQTSIIKAGLALTSGKRDYLHRYVIDSQVKKTLMCFVIADPGRWFQPTPTSNPMLRRFDRDKDSAVTEE